MPINLDGLTDGEVRTTLVQMDKLALYKLSLLGLFDVEKSELASYQLRDVALSWYNVW